MAVRKFYVVEENVGLPHVPDWVPLPLLGLRRGADTQAEAEELIERLLTQSQLGRSINECRITVVFVRTEG